MGLEAQCMVTHDGKRAKSHVHLDATEVQVRGGHTLRIPFSAVKTIDTSADGLTIQHPAGTTVLELGDQSVKWFEKISNPPTLLMKLGAKAGQRVAIIGKVDPEFVAQLQECVGAIGKAKTNVDLLFYAVNDRADLERIESLKGMLAPDGALWIIRPKGVKSVTERDVMTAGKAAGLVDTKVVRFSDTHTAEKLVIPIKSR